MNKSQNETFYILFSLRLGIGERACRHRNIVADIRKLDGRSSILSVNRGPAVELKSARSRTAPQEDECQRAILRGVAGSDRYDVRFGAGHNLSTTLQVRGIRQQHAKRRAIERPT